LTTTGSLAVYSIIAERSIYATFSDAIFAAPSSDLPGTLSLIRRRRLSFAYRSPISIMMRASASA